MKTDYLTVSRWRPNLKPSQDQITSTLVWVRFSKLPIRVDDTTLDPARGKYAKACIKIDLDKPLIPFITILGCKQHVEYEGMLLICFEYGKYGTRDMLQHEDNEGKFGT